MCYDHILLSLALLLVICEQWKQRASQTTLSIDMEGAVPACTLCIQCSFLIKVLQVLKHVKGKLFSQMRF